MTQVKHCDITLMSINSFKPKNLQQRMWILCQHLYFVQCSAVQCSAVQCSAVQCSAVQCSAVHVCMYIHSKHNELFITINITTRNYYYLFPRCNLFLIGY